MTTTADPWEKAADCERSLQADRDPQRRVVLEKLRDLWVALANQKFLSLLFGLSMSITANGFQADVEVLGKPHGLTHEVDHLVIGAGIS
jgi:hypothetical protein